MKDFTNYSQVVAIKEMSAGNESVGSMWLETRVFNKTEPISNIIEWAKHTDGKVIIAIEESKASNKYKGKL